ncbi:tripartite tricarboxylate transporter substrate binding protein [Ramlibacter sp. G-1-2-2]|uniref:Tripartite tricarboxylate transporter substrate binding protein n=1 Tax=Ramlibacter agri TaxID=2728837 RepID=A0A848HE08_9BURK|nr:tripartite tricarboxylate transporter substrate binding protein [Ramlibacter agri]NML45798.1 tripartite tricarboxylate transporter substrate binding protein [Ramlibacter agri]
MLRRTFAVACLALATASAALAQSYPSKPIRLIVPFPPGGGTDQLSRLISAKLAESEKWNVIADNRAGAGGTLGIAETVKQPPTGYDLVMGQKDNLVVAPWLYKNVGFDTTKDLVAVAHVAYTPVVIVVRADSKFKTLKDVVAAAKAAPDTVTFGSPGNGTTIHLAGEIFNKEAGIKLRHVPYKGSNPALVDVLAGNVDMLVSSVPSALQQIKAGKLRALAVTSAKRSSSLPDTPTVAESGYPGMDVATWYGIFAPAGTPKEVVDKVHTAVNKLLTSPDVVKAIHEQGAEPQAMTEQQFTELVKADYRKWEGIVKASGAKIE